MLKLSVITPIYNEEAVLPAYLDAAVEWDCVHEIIFVDGGSTDASRSMLEGLTVLTSEKGRGFQCRVGAEHATGDAFVFVHADTIIPASSMRAIYHALSSGVPWGCLTLRFTKATPDRLIGSWAANSRVRWNGIPFGDQTMFMTREAYEAVGGMPELPIMEDYELSMRLKAAFGWPKQLSGKAFTSPRRFESGGNIRVMMQMRRLRYLHRQGMNVEETARRYGEGRHESL